MNIKELSIGNWVELNCSNWKIHDINKIGIIHLEDYFGNIIQLTSDYIINEIKPIQITDEIIDKNFTKDKRYEDNRTWIIKESTTYPTIHIYPIDNGTIYEVQFCDINIQYVHQLQNILTLLGIDKEIEL